MRDKLSINISTITHELGSHNDYLLNARSAFAWMGSYLCFPDILLQPTLFYNDIHGL